MEVPAIRTWRYPGVCPGSRSPFCSIVLGLVLVAFGSTHRVHAADPPEEPFGLLFGESVPADLLGPATPVVVAGAPLPELHYMHRDRPPGMPAAWRPFVPPVIPASFRGARARYMALVDEKRLPLRLRVSVLTPGGGCAAWFNVISQLVDNRYGSENTTDTPGASTGRDARRTFAATRVWRRSPAGVELMCTADNNAGLLEYTDISRLRAWQLRERIRIGDWLRELAGTVIESDRVGIRSAFGLSWRDVSPLASGIPDATMNIDVPEPFEHMPAAEYEAVFNPAGRVVSVTARSCPAAASRSRLMELLGEMLRAQPGSLLKNLPQHVIVQLGSDVLAARERSDGCLHLSIVSRDRQRARSERRDQGLAAAEVRRQARQASALRGL